MQYSIQLVRPDRFNISNRLTAHLVAGRVIINSNDLSDCRNSVIVIDLTRILPKDLARISLRHIRYIKLLAVVALHPLVGLCQYLYKNDADISILRLITIW